MKNSAHDIEQRGRALPKSDDWKNRLNPELKHGSPLVFVGAVAGGEKVVASTRSTTAEFLHKYYSDALAVEMEGRGFLEAVNINSLVLGGVIRGISDMLSGKSDGDERARQRLAADAASAAAFEILHALPPPRRSRTPIKKQPKVSTSPRRRPKKATSAAVDVIASAPQLPPFLETA